MAQLRTAPQIEPAGAPRFIWSHPQEGLRFAAWGEAQRVEALPVPEPGSTPWFGAMAFGGRLGVEWEGFAPLRFVRPLRIAPAPAPGPRSLPPPSRVVRSTAERQHWSARVERALQAIARGTLSKVVMARTVDVEAETPLHPESLLAALESRHPSCRCFLVRGDDGSAFLGATPELLCSIEGDRLETEALAGSAPPAEAPSLLGNAKELREHQWVVEHITQALRGVAAEVTHPPEPGLRVLANVAHLRTPIAARLLPGRSARDVVAALHPTPAVGGVPTDAALRFIAEEERFDRGLYAGVVGWVAPGRAELAVALRSALVRGKRARLFVGAGIVEGSSPEREFEETELKARALLEALGVAP
jgi:salicylate biosynthesis isochorismate synthase/menaquinone-specific isochorismate synthase